MNPNLSDPVRTVSFLLVLLLPLFAPAIPASAGVFEGNGEIGFDFGWVDLEGRDYRGGAGQGRFTLRGGYHLNDHFQLEAQLIGTEFDGPGGGDSLGGIFANAVFNFHPGEVVVPYVLVGVGAVSLESAFGHGHDGHHHSLHSPHSPHSHSYDDEYEGSGALQLGVGSRFFFGPGRTAIRLEASVLAFEDEFDREHSLLSLSVGLTWRLGKYKPPKVTVVGGTH